MKNILLLSFLFIFTFSQKIAATPVDIIQPKTPTEKTVHVKKKKKKKRFFARMTERIMKRRMGKLIKKLGLAPEDCARIIKTDGEELDVVIIKVGPERIRYKKCDFQNGPTRSIRKEEIFMIKYADGTKEIITDVEGLKENQRKTRKISDKDDVDDRSTRQDWTIGFLAGILLGLIGVLIIAIAMTGNSRKRALRGALAGILTSVLLVLTLAMLIFSFA